MKKLAVLATLCLVSSAHAEKWNPKNNPSLFNIVSKSPMRLDLASLPLAAKLHDEHIGWSETYWPAKLGGVAYRWNSPNPQPFKYKLKTKAELLKMSERELSELSPAELYDVSQGDYGFTLTKRVLAKNAPTDLWWEGICHGWALAASHYPEPERVTVTNKDGIKVPFGSSDVKGLMSLHDAYNSAGAYARIGERCDVPGKVAGEAFPEDGVVPAYTQADANISRCADVNAGAFHVVITNMIGLNSLGFVADVDRFNDIWNQPIVGYESKVIGNVAVTAAEFRNGIASKVRMTNIMTYGEELEFYSHELEAEGVIGFVQKDPVTGTQFQTYNSRSYEYILELDAQNKIVGGTWISESRPDFLWMKKKDLKFNNGRPFIGFPLEGLNRIYKPRQ